MHRRNLLRAGAAMAAAGASTLFPIASHGKEPRAGNAGEHASDRLAGMTLRQLRDDYHDRLFNQYLPFWENGGIDRQHGGFMCELNDDGSVADGEKFLWYQGRGIWVYSFLYNEFGKDRRWLEIARQARDFMLRHMYIGDGKWNERVERDGKLMVGLGKNVYGWLFAAMGLMEYCRATGKQEDLDLAKQSIWAAIQAYDDPAYSDTHTISYTGLDLDSLGLRSQGHSMVIVAILTDLLAHYPDARLEDLQRKHVDLIVNKFWNPQYRIVNEYLRHDYGRDPVAETHMLTGHSIETLRIVMDEAVRRKDWDLFATASDRVRHLLEMCWDHNFDGLGDGNFQVFGTKNTPRGPGYDIKTMWAQCETMSACMTALEHSDADWAARWFGCLREFTLKVMPVPGHGVWRQAVDRFGRDVKRVNVSTKRKDNFHQVRYLMLDLLSLDRMIAKSGS